MLEGLGHKDWLLPVYNVYSAVIAPCFTADDVFHTDTLDAIGQADPDLVCPGRMQSTNAGSGLIVTL